MRLNKINKYILKWVKIGNLCKKNVSCMLFPRATYNGNTGLLFSTRMHNIDITLNQKFISFI